MKNVSLVSLQAGEEGYLEAFKTELEAFKSRVRIRSQSQGFQASVSTGIVEGLDSLSQVGFLLPEMNIGTLLGIEFCYTLEKMYFLRSRKSRPTALYLEHCHF